MLSFCLSQDWTWADCASRLLFFPWPSPYLQPPLGNARHLSFPLRCEFQIQVVPLLGLVSFIVFSVTVEILSLERGGVLQWGAYDRAQGRRQRTGWLLANLDHWALLPSSLAAKCGHMIEFWPGIWWRWWVQLPELAHETLSLSPSPAIREEHLPSPSGLYWREELPSCQVIEFREGTAYLF